MTEMLRCRDRNGRGPEELINEILTPARLGWSYGVNLYFFGRNDLADASLSLYLNRSLSNLLFKSALTEA